MPVTAIEDDFVERQGDIHIPSGVARGYSRDSVSFSEPGQGTVFARVAPDRLKGAAMIRRILPFTALILATCATSAPADEASGPFASGVFAATVTGSKSHPSVGGSFGYRFNSVLGLEVELTAVPKFEPRLDGNQVIAFGTAPADQAGRGVSIVDRDRDGRAVFLTTNFRVAIPAGVRRVAPYFIAGGGLASLRQTERIRILSPIPLRMPGAPSGGTVSTPAIFPVPSFSFSRSTTDLLLGLGGGVSFLLGKGLSLDADLRYYRVLSARDTNIGRFGMGVGYRF